MILFSLIGIAFYATIFVLFGFWPMVGAWLCVATINCTVFLLARSQHRSDAKFAADLAADILNRNKQRRRQPQAVRRLPR